MTHDYEEALKLVNAGFISTHSSTQTGSQKLINTIRHALSEMQTLTAQNKLLAEAVVALKEARALPALYCHAMDNHAHAIQLAAQITGDEK